MANKTRQQAVKDSNLKHPETKKNWYKKNKERILLKSKTRYEQKKELIKKKNKKYREANKEKINLYFRIKNKKDVRYNLSHRISRMINEKIKKNSVSWVAIVDFSREEIKKHLENTIPENFSWNDFLEGKLHIDHIIPVSKFKFSSFEDLEFKKCWNLRNLRLIPKKENLSKANKINYKLIEELKIVDLLPQEANYGNQSL